MKRFWLPILALVLFGLDQWTKWLVLQRLDFHESQTIVSGFFDLIHVTNTGAAFGAFQNGNSMFIVLSVGTLLGLLIFSWRGAFTKFISQLAVSLLVAGILGNLTDRLWRGHVIDFLDFHWGAKHWPAFNVADSCICVAVGLLLVESLWSDRKSPRA